MPSRCCVPFCKGNYDTGPKVSVYSFPKDEEIKQKWLQVIQRANFQPSKSSKVSFIIYFNVLKILIVINFVFYAFETDNKI